MTDQEVKSNIEIKEEDETNFMSLQTPPILGLTTDRSIESSDLVPISFTGTNKSYTVTLTNKFVTHSDMAIAFKIIRTGDATVVTSCPNSIADIIESISIYMADKNILHIQKRYVGIHHLLNGLLNCSNEEFNYLYSDEYFNKGITALTPAQVNSIFSTSGSYFFIRLSNLSELFKDPAIRFQKNFRIEVKLIDDIGQNSSRFNVTGSTFAISEMKFIYKTIIPTAEFQAQYDAHPYFNMDGKQINVQRLNTGQTNLTYRAGFNSTAATHLGAICYNPTTNLFTYPSLTTSQISIDGGSLTQPRNLSEGLEVVSYLGHTYKEINARLSFPSTAPSLSISELLKVGPMFYIGNALFPRFDSISNESIDYTIEVVDSNNTAIPANSVLYTWSLTSKLIKISDDKTSLIINGK